MIEVIQGLPPFVAPALRRMFKIKKSCCPEFVTQDIYVIFRKK